MKWLLLLAFLHSSLSHVCQPSILQFPYKLCPENDSPSATLKENLETDGWQGQADALQQVERLFKEYLHRKKRDRPLVLHFSGPTGVGKSHLAKALAKALFVQRNSDEDAICGLLYLIMERHLRHIPEESMKSTFETNIRDPIVEQLKYCPRSVIVLDDIQHAHVGLIEELKSALDTSALIKCPQHLCQPSQPNLSTKSAIFILVSDLEPDHAKRLLTGDLSKKEAIKIIQELADNRWGGRSQGSKMMKLLTVVPFLPLTGYDLHNILLRKIKDFGEKIRAQLQLEASTNKLPYNIEWDGRVWPVKGTEERILELMDPTLGARVVDSYLRQHAYFLIDPLVEQLLELSKTPAAIKDPPLPFSKLDVWHALGKYTKPTHVVLHDIQVRLEDKELTMELVQSVDSSDSFGNHNEDL